MEDKIVNPVGKAQNLDVIENKLAALASQWDEERAAEETASWWEVWKWGRKVSLFKVTKFLIVSLDELIHAVDDIIEKGPDKKATVLNAIDKLYEYVIKEAMPIYLKPFAGKVKDYIVNTLVSTAIDWIVSKYRDGAWRDKIEEIAHEEK